MNISSKRFHIRDAGAGQVLVRDRDAPYHLHTVKRSELPTVTRMAYMTEDQFDAAVSRAIWRESE